MTIEEGKKELKSYGYNKKFIEERLGKIQQTGDLIEKIIYTIEEDTKQRNLMNTAKGISDIVELTFNLQMLIEELIQRQSNIEYKIKQLEKPFQDILYWYYIKEESMTQIQNRMNYTEEEIQMLYIQAIEKYCSNS